MATRAVHARLSGPEGTLLTKKASGTVVMGALVIKGFAADSVSPSASPTASPYATTELMGVALYSEAYAKENAAEQFTIGQVLNVETLVPGQCLKLKAIEAITEGQVCEATVSGQVRTKLTGSTAIQLFMANAAVDAGAYGEFIVL